MPFLNNWEVLLCKKKLPAFSDLGRSVQTVFASILRINGAHGGNNV